MASARYSLKAGEPLTAELAASLLMHRNGVCRDWEKGMSIIPFINKVDSDEDLPTARALARALISNSNFPVEKVVWGSLKNKNVASWSSSAQ
jgi:hypothetical protein